MLEVKCPFEQICFQIQNTAMVLQVGKKPDCKYKSVTPASDDIHIKTCRILFFKEHMQTCKARV